MALEMRKNEASKGYLVEINEPIPVGEPHKSQKGKGNNDVYQGGRWVRTKTNGNKKEHLYRININVTDCGEVKN